MICVWSVYEVFMKCLCSVYEVFMNCFWTVYELLRNCLWSVYELFMTCLKCLSLWSVYEVFMMSMCDFAVDEIAKLTANACQQHPCYSECFNSSFELGSRFTTSWVSILSFFAPIILVCVSQTFACVFTWWFSHWVGLLWCIESASDHARDLCPVLLFVMWADSCRPFCCTPFAAFVVFFLCYMGLGWSGFLWIKRQRFSFWGSFRYARFLCWLVVRLFCYLHLGSLSLSVLHGSCLLILSSLPGSSP